MTTHHLRSQFLIDPSVVYLNHGGFGACPRPVFEEYQRWQLELERQPSLFFSRNAKEFLKHSRQKLAEYLGTSPNNIIYVTNATTGGNYVAQSLDLQPGDEILTTDHEYGAMDRLWDVVCQRSGARYVRVAVPLPITSVDDLVDRIWSAVTPRTRVIFMSHITSPTALIFPVEAICRRAREAGILTVIDGAHAPGQIPVDLDTLGADFYTGNCHKWMCAPKGSAFLYAHPQHQSTIKPLVVSWDWEDESDFVRLNQWQGTRDIAPFLAVPAVIEFMQTHDWATIREQSHVMARDIRRRICDWYGVEPISPDSSDYFAQMFTVLLPETDAFQLQAAMYESHRVQAAIGNWHNQLQVRVSVQGYNTPADLDTLFDALTRHLPRT